MQPTILTKRVYEQASSTDGYRVLVDRLWPRGLKKEKAAIDEWAKDLAPTTALREWWNHDPALWPEFQKRYKVELRHNEAIPAFIKDHGHKKTITLVYGAKDTLHNQALVLQQYLTQQFEGG